MNLTEVPKGLIPTDYLNCNSTVRFGVNLFGTFCVRTIKKVMHQMLAFLFIKIGYNSTAKTVRLGLGDTIAVEVAQFQADLCYLLSKLVKLTRLSKTFRTKSSKRSWMSCMNLAR
jgi:hypothetical protein